jgi:hypothetical protein
LDWTGVLEVKTLKETTEDLLAHTYLVDVKRGKMYAYRKDSGEIQVFSKPLTFDKRYRKFEEVVDTELETSYTVYNS